MFSITDSKKALDYISKASESNNDEVAMQTTAIETVETFMDSKKHNQCIVTNPPTASNSKKFFLENDFNCFVNIKNTIKLIHAIPIRYQTR